MKKRFLATFLAMVMVLSVVPNLAFAENEIEAETAEAADTVAENAADESIGVEAELGNKLYYIEDGNLLSSVDSARPSTVDTDVVWVRERDGLIYYAKIDGNNTDVYKSGDGGFRKYARLFCPIDAFDVEDGFLYYSYNGEVFKLDVETGKEETVMADKDLMGFCVEEKEIYCLKKASKSIININSSDLNSMKKKTVLAGGIYYTNPNMSGTKQLYLYNTDGEKKCYIDIDKNSKLMFGGLGFIYLNPNDKKDEYYLTCNTSFLETNGYALIRKKELKGILTSDEPSDKNSYTMIDVAYVNGDIRFNTFSNENAGIYEVNDNNAAIELKEKPSKNSKTTWVGKAMNAVANWFKNLWNNIINLFGSDSSNTVTVLGTVKNSEGEWIKLANEQYVKKEQFLKAFKKVPNSSGVSAISIYPTSYPTGTIRAASFSLAGSIVSNCNISSITASVVNVSTGVAELSKTVYPGTMTYSIQGSAIDNGIRFGNLKNGNTYYLEYVVADNTGNSKTWKSANFNVGSGSSYSAPIPNVRLESIEYGQRLVMESNGTGALLHMTFAGGEHSGYDTITYDFITPGTYSTDVWTTKGSSVSEHVYNTFSVNKQSAPSIGDAVYHETDPVSHDGYATVTISGEGEIHYTLDGSTPSKGSPLYTGPIRFDKNSSSCTVKAISTKWGCANSDVAEKWQNISPPDAPSITLNTKDKLAQGKTTSVSWQPTARATSYTAVMYRGGTEVNRVTTSGTSASFLLGDRSDTENFEYHIRVYASNFKGNSADSNQATVWGMHPVKVTFVDRIIRSGELTEDRLREVKRKLDNREGEGTSEKLENQVISIQKVDYDEYPSKPSTPSKKGFTFAGWTAGLYEPAIIDKTVYGEFDINYYNVTFYDVGDDNKRTGEPLSSKKYMYTSEAELPDNYEVPFGYVFEGWNIDSSNSTCFDLTYIDGNIIADAAYGWENPDLPQCAEITNILRSSKSYDVTVSIKNFPVEDSQGRIVVSLYTSEGRNVYTQISEDDLDPGTLREFTGVKTVTLLYDGKISYAKAYIVGVKNDKTGGALSEAAYSNNITYKYSDFWSNWSEYKTAEEWAAEGINVNAPTSEFEVDKPKIQYRYRNKSYNYSNSSTLDGWIKYDTRVTSYGSTQGPVYYDPSGNNRNVWSEQYVTSSNYKDVYRYYRIADSEHALWGASYWAYAYRYNYEYDSPLELKPGTSYSYYKPCGCSTLSLRGDWYHTVYSVNYIGEAYPERRWVSDNYGTRWYYQEPIYTYYYYKWQDWSDWSDYSQPGTETQKRTVYRYRTLTKDDSETEAENGYTDSISGFLPDMGTEYVTEEVFNQGKHEYVSGPYYIKNSEAENDEDKYISVEESSRKVTEYRYGRYTNGSYTMPCPDCAEELYGGEWQLEWTDWSETPCDTVNDDEYSCEYNQEHTHDKAKYEDGIDYWNEYIIGDQSYCFAEERVVNKEITYDDPVKYYKVKTNLEGKVATVMVYKKNNNDPTQGQLEFVDQIKIGENNSYSFSINTKEFISYSGYGYDGTGDFIVTLAIQKIMRPINIKVIEADVPEHNVKFYVNGEEYRIEPVKHGKAVDLNKFSIEDIEAMNPGYRFVKWDKSVVDVTEDMDINAIMVPKTYSVVFVDYENQTTDLQELAYGETIPAPEVEPVEGKIFLGWDNVIDKYTAIPENTEVDDSVERYYLLVDGKTYIRKADYNRTIHTLKDETEYFKTQTTAVVTGNMIITAKWKTLEYNVKFVDFDDNIISEQTVAYGESAELPEFITKEDRTYMWDLAGEEWWNVTKDMVIRPYDTTVSTVAPPVLDASLADVGGSFYASLSAEDEESKIYYSYYNEITEKDAKMYAERRSIESEYEHEGISLSGINLFGDDEDDEGDAEIQEDYDEGYSALSSIREYTEPIEITEGTVIYAFTVDKDGNISPIAVFEYGYDDSEDEGIIENTYEIDPDCPQITLPSLTVKPGETVEVPVSIKNNPGLTNLSLVFGYDTDNLTLVSATNGDVFANTEYSADTREDGNCKFTWLSKSLNEKDGTLLTLTFKAGDNAGKEKIFMTIEEASAPSEEEQPFATQDGTVQNVGNNAYYGDINGDGEADFADAVMLIRYDIGLLTLTDQQKKFGDVNGDGEVDFADAIRIMRFDAGFISKLR